MIIIKLDKNISIEKALRLYKSKLIKIRQNNELISRKKFEKKSVIKRKQILNAKYIQKLKTNNEF